MLISELKLTSKQKSLLGEIAKSHPYFPELAIDDFKFNNKLYKRTDFAMQDLIDKGIIVKGSGKSNLELTKSYAKKIWEDILSTIPVDKAYSPVSLEFLRTRSIEVLRKAYNTLTSKPADDLDKETLINEIYNSYNKGEKNMTDTKKTTEVKKSTVAKKATVKKEAPVNDGKLTPKQIASQYKMSSTEVRKALRAFYKGKCEGGNWRINPDDIEGIIEEYKAKKAEASKARSERMKAMIEAKKAEKEASAEKAPKVVKKSATKAKPSKKAEEVEDDKDK